MSKFLITPKEDPTITMTIRIEKRVQEQFNDLAARTNRSRNELMNMALQYALDNMEIVEEAPLEQVTTREKTEPYYNEA